MLVGKRVGGKKAINVVLQKWGGTEISGKFQVGRRPAQYYPPT